MWDNFHFSFFLLLKLSEFVKTYREFVIINITIISLEHVYKSVWCFWIAFNQQKEIQMRGCSLGLIGSKQAHLINANSTNLLV